MPADSSLPAITLALARLAHTLHLAFEHVYADADALYARADACWKVGDRTGYTRLMQEHARLHTTLDDLNALDWAATRATRDLAAHLATLNHADRF